MIRAPAGWGKSTLRSQWRAAEQGRRHFAWLTLNSSDSDPTRFWTYAVEALRTLDPEVGRASLPLLRAPGVDLLSEMLPVLVDELGEIQAPLVLALDDYHQLAGDAVHGTLRRLLDYLPERVCIAIGTHASSRRCRWRRLRARGQLVEINADELRFSLDEARSFLDEVLGLELGDADIARLHERTEGWPAAIYPAALSLRTRPDRHIRRAVRRR